MRKQLTATLFDGSIVKEGDMIEYEYRKGFRVGLIKTGFNGRLYFWDQSIKLSSLKTAKKIG